MADTSNSNGAPLPSAAPSILKIVVATWTMVFRAIADMPGLAAMTFALLTLHSLIALGAPDLKSVEALPSAVASAAVRALIALPLTIAVFRYALLHEVPTASGFGVARLRFAGARRLIGFAVFYDTVFTLLLGLLNPLENDELYVAAGIVFALAIAFIAFGIVTMMYMPSLAVDAPGASIANALRDSKGRFWKISFTAMWVSLPIIAAYLLVSLAAETTSNAAAAPASLGGTAINAAIDTLGMVVTSAMASYLYVAFADRLGRPANVVLLKPTGTL